MERFWNNSQGFTRFKAVSKLNNNNQIASRDTRFETSTRTSLLQPFSPIVIAANENEWIRVWDYEEEGTSPQWL
ncbi:hypothetical protein V6N13_058784 [Hibiscus sabdariffa]